MKLTDITNGITWGGGREFTTKTPAGFEQFNRTEQHLEHSPDRAYILNRVRTT